MLGKIILAAGLLAVATAVAPYAASAISPAAAPSAGPSDLIVQVKGKKGSSGGGKSSHHHHHHRGRGGVVIGVGYCTIQAASCADAYGEGTRRYYRCLRRHGC